MQIIIHALKYDEMVVVGDLLGTRLAEMFQGTLFSLQLNVLTAVPLHPVRLREKGYNQSNQLGEAISKHLNLPFSACAAAMKRFGTKFVAVLTAGTPYFHGLDSQGKT